MRKGIELKAIQEEGGLLKNFLGWLYRYNMPIAYGIAGLAWENCYSI